MKSKIIIIIPYLFFVVQCFSQNDFLAGTWQGLKVKTGQTYDKAEAIWFDFEINNNELTGESRIEFPFTDFYALKTIKGKVISKNEIEFQDLMLGNKKSKSGSTWCTLKGKLIYNETTGYLEGNYSSTDCRMDVGKIILYRSPNKMSNNEKVSMYHSWFNNLVHDLNKGWKAYYERDKEMKNFQFQPVLFDHDKDEVKEEFHEYLISMIKVIESHTDLRIKIIGHTDSNGTDEYNIGLSERRATAIKDFLISQGMKADRIVIEYRGKRDPAVPNDTPLGKQLNRRVDFEFV